MTFRKDPCLDLPVFKTKGCHYDVGYNIGTNFSRNIQTFFRNSIVVTKIIPFYDTRKGREHFECFLKVATECYPQFIAEMKGMSGGSGVPFEKIFLLNMAPEIKNIMFLQTEDQGCSTVFVNNPDEKLLVHNEDWNHMVGPLGYMVNADIEDEGCKESFLSMCCPGILPGNCFFVNGHGTVVTVNSLCPHKVTLGAPPRYFLNRSLIGMSDISDGRRLALNEGFGCSYGFSANIASIKAPRSMYILEFESGNLRNRVHIEEVPEGTTTCPNYHFRCNKYQYLDVKERNLLRSSDNRQQRAAEFPPIRKLQDALAVLGDTKNEQYPIYRTRRGNDGGETVCTVAMDLLRRTMTVYYYKNPKTSNTYFTFSLEL